jgi:hypothetical protein
MRLRRFSGVVLAVICLVAFSGAAAFAAHEEVAGKPLALPLAGDIQAFFTKGIYTYINLDVPDFGSVWVIAPVCSIKVGQRLEIIAGQSYGGGYSEQTGLTFDYLVVASQAVLQGQDIKFFDGHKLPQGCATSRPAK